MRTIKLWRVNTSSGDGLEVEQLKAVVETKTEQLLEDILTTNPGLLMPDLKLVGRQTETPGGPLDLLGVDGEGVLVVFELKRGILTREAVAQVIDYGSFLVSLDADDLATHISQRSGNLGTEKIDDFLSWYQEQFANPLEDHLRPRLVLVGLGADERTRRMVEFLSSGDFDVSLITFHAFEIDGGIALARQVEVEAPSRPSSASATKTGNLELLKQRTSKLGVDTYYFDVARFVREILPGYEWPNPSGFSYALSELTEAGTPTYRSYIALFLRESKPGRIQILLYERAVEAITSEPMKPPECFREFFEMKPNGTAEMWIESTSHWNDVQDCVRQVCDAVSEGWKLKSNAITAQGSAASGSGVQTFRLDPDEGQDD